MLLLGFFLLLIFQAFAAAPGGTEAVRTDITPPPDEPESARTQAKAIETRTEEAIGSGGTAPAATPQVGIKVDTPEGTAKIPSGSTVSVSHGDLSASLISNYDTDDLSTAEFVGMTNAVITKDTVSASYVNRFSSNSFSASRIENVVYHRATHVLEFDRGSKVKVKSPSPINIDKVGKSKVELGPNVVVNITLIMPQQNTVWVFGNPLKSDSLALDDESFTDSDKDGLSDKVESRLGTSPQLADTDNDGLSDRDEVLVYPTRETVANSFPDAGVSSDKEFVAWLESHVDDLTGALHDTIIQLGNTRDPFRDRDSDGISDIIEHVSGLNISNDDSDSDGMSDSEELVRDRSPTIAQQERAVGAGVACMDCVMQVEGDRGDQVSIDFSGYTGNKPGSKVSIGLDGVDVSVVGSEQGIDGKLVQEKVLVVFDVLSKDALENASQIKRLSLKSDKNR